MKFLLLLVITILSFTIVGQTSEEIEMITIVNQLRTDPKSFIPVVEDYIKKLKITQEPIFDIKGVTITKRTNNIKSVNHELITEAKKLILFLNHVTPVKELMISENLYLIAKTQVTYIDSIKTITHAGKNCNSVTKRFTDNFILCGENCVIAPSLTEALLILLIDSGNNSKGHRTNIFLSSFTKISIAHKNQYWVQDFGY